MYKCDDALRRRKYKTDLDKGYDTAGGGAARTPASSLGESVGWRGAHTREFSGRERRVARRAHL
eukprot:CAMPEP_0206226820 /NCGR_PEP_ID=MMETSP0047_2-20121206/8296_1 /ASSEMBLY_ACC=CAM_ASM_000192 /TAXON_ID=195065 /ORGANISM="Chroomonas mesostigmatica_cf, Strain CCMP1168" /LENGTH=63 /DNA_ID=CAMNT_0053649935 /DNA_START=179 /DNA_END=370 /DNA_ORIENTATION=-